MARRSVSLATSDLKELERELRGMADGFAELDHEAAYRLCEEVGLPVAVAACKSSTVAEAIHVERTPRGAALVASGERASYEEFGTGIVGRRREADPLDAKAMAQSGYVVDGMGHGIYGWNYMGEDGRWHWTLGRMGSSYMAKAAEAMRQRGAKVVLAEMANLNRQHFRSLQPGPGPDVRG